MSSSTHEKTRSLAFLLPYGEPSDGYFSDVLPSMLCARARRAGHEARVVRVYYDGRDPARDAEVARRLSAWLAEHEIDTIVVDRLFDPAPLVARRAADPNARGIFLYEGNSLDVLEGIDHVVGLTEHAAPTRRRQPTQAELVTAFEALLPTLGASEPVDVAGVSRVVDGELLAGPPMPPPKPLGAFEAEVHQDVVCLDAPPKVIRKVLEGNVGCPFAADVAENPFFEGAELPADGRLARLGCAFCYAGGDYQKRQSGEVVAELIEQAGYFAARMPELEEIVLGDQAPIRYLAALVRAAHDAGLRPLRWLFAARADVFVKSRDRVVDAIEAARESGQQLEVYLTGFESFSDRELARYNKGATVQQLVQSVRAMRELAAAHPGVFHYAETRGHSLILWSPWTLPADIADSVEVIRRNGLGELFDELGGNRLRLYEDLPLHHAARRDGALSERWAPGDEGAGRRKGYNQEHPWRFLDGRTQLAYRLAKRLRERLGAETEAAQLAAVAAFAERAEQSWDVDAIVAEVSAGLDALEAALSNLLRPERGPDAPSRGRALEAALVRFTGACNNGCRACAQRDVWLDDRELALAARVERARSENRPIVLAGREPTIHPAFLRLVRLARGDDERPVGLVTNGRRFAVPGFARAAVRAGLQAASVKLFGPEAALADAASRDPGGFDQAVSGVRALRQAGVDAVELRIPLSSSVLDQVDAYVDLAQRLDVPQLRVEVALDAVGLGRLADTANAIERLARRCREAGVALEAVPLTAASRGLAWFAG